MAVRKIKWLRACGAAVLLAAIMPGVALAQSAITLGQISFSAASGSSLVPGATVTATVTVTANTAVANGNLLVAFFDPSVTIEPGAPSTNLAVALNQAANTTQTYSIPYTLPIDTTPGTETVQVQPYNSDWSATLADGESSSFTVAPPLGPVTLGQAVITPGTLFPGQSVTVTIPVATNSAAVSNDPLLFAFFDPSQVQPDGTLAPGATSTNLQVLMSQAAGTIQNYSVTYQLPTNTTIGTEDLVVSGYSPNYQSMLAGAGATGSFQVVGRPPPPALAVDSGAINPMTVAPGTTTSLSAIVTANQAVSGAPVLLAVFAPGAFSITNGVVSVDSGNSINVGAEETLSAGQTATVTVPFTLPATDSNGNPMPTGKYLMQVTTWAPGFQAILDTEDYLFDVANPSPATVAAPGPSLADYQAPFYSCSSNFYVGPNGDDGNPGTLLSPWQSIQGADSAARQAGDCINVAPGTYANAITLTNGGNAPSSSGYVVYRCEALDACHVLAPATGPQVGAPLWRLASPANFVVIDGFEVDGNKTDGINGLAPTCVDSSWDDNRFLPAPNNDAVHHVHVLNNIVHDCSLAGISLSNTEWVYILHNDVYNNSWTSGYQGSGIGMVVEQCLESGNAACASGVGTNGATVNDTTAALGSGSYVPAGMDLTYFAPYHIVVAYNDVFSNSVGLVPTSNTACGGHTDGNGIIFDTWQNEIQLNQNGVFVPYPFQSLAFGNVSAFNGGRGVHVFATSNVTVANNTTYGNGTDDCIDGYFLADLSQSGGQNNIWVNNIGLSVLTAPDATCEGADPTGVAGQTTFCGGRQAPLIAGNGRGITDANNFYKYNVLSGGNGVQLFDNDIGTFPAAVNYTADPLLNSPAAGDYSLQLGSPAIGGATQILFGATLPIPVLADIGACQSALPGPCPALPPISAPALAAPAPP